MFALTTYATTKQIPTVFRKCIEIKLLCSKSFKANFEPQNLDNRHLLLQLIKWSHIYMNGGAPNLHFMPLPFLAEYNKKQVSPTNPSCIPLKISLLSKI